MNSPENNVDKAPDYIRQFVRQPTKSSVAELLFDGNWCGHGEDIYRVYVIADDNNFVFELQLPDTESEERFPTAVKATTVDSEKSFLIYDTRQHPASFYSYGDNAKKKTKFADKCCCSKCSGGHFKIAVGFEIPEDSDSPNDTTWFVLATECIQCGDRIILFEDETA